jgi:cytochrome c553
MDTGENAIFACIDINDKMRSAASSAHLGFTLQQACPPPELDKEPLMKHPKAVVAALLALGALQLSPAWANDAAQLRTRSLAATCAHCHGTDGHAVEGQPLIRLAGLDKNYIFTQLMAFRTGQRPATVMHQITKGYSQQQLEEIASYFASRK